MLQTQSSQTSELRAHDVQLNREKAQLNTIMGVLNCYLREFALPNQQVEWHYQSTSLPQTLKRNYSAKQRVAVHLSQQNGVLVLPIHYASKLGKIKLAELPWAKMPGSGWAKLDATQTLTLLLNYLKQVLAIPFNHELIEQLENSVLVTEQFLNVAPKSHHNEFIASEQSLIWGHTFHPTPKSRSGVTMDDLLAFSPEVGAQVPLYWFEVDTSLLDVLSSDGEANPAQRMLQQLAPQHTTSYGKTLYPCHPWESYTILSNPSVKRAIEQGKITPLGLGGEKMQPTSSVRTLYHPDMDWFAKFSINVRLTNCVRKKRVVRTRQRRAAHVDSQTNKRKRTAAQPRI